MPDNKQKAVKEENSENAENAKNAKKVADDKAQGASDSKASNKSFLRFFTLGAKGRNNQKTQKAQKRFVMIVSVSVVSVILLSMTLYSQLSAYMGQSRQGDVPSYPVNSTTKTASLPIGLGNVGEQKTPAIQRGEKIQNNPKNQRSSHETASAQSSDSLATQTPFADGQSLQLLEKNTQLLLKQIASLSERLEHLGQEVNLIKSAVNQNSAMISQSETVLKETITTKQSAYQAELSSLKTAVLSSVREQLERLNSALNVIARQSEIQAKRIAESDNAKMIADKSKNVSFSLQNIMRIDRSLQAVLHNQLTRSNVMVAAGDMIDGWQIKSIDPQCVTFTQAQGEFQQCL
ncbi:hypothetical protein [Cysteiniphilum marinum]|uniref:hypothetical protein n=1 Tax=Cysteiniphilum marinum TaxID=2774191 RepID=UPI00193B3254|nr:hypothetical protein [Cysteiniphilum marinum]